MTTTVLTDLRELSLRCRGDVVLPGDAGWDAARQAWSLSADQRPAAVAVPFDAADVVAIVRFARDAGLRVAPQGTGHNAGALGDLSHSILLRTHAMRGVEIDPVARRARVRAGVLWEEVMDAAGAHGLAALGGSSPDVGVVGYSLGGGIGWLARRYGLATNSILAAEIVTPDGEWRRVDEDHDPDLFWALRGGGGNFGIVTALELELFPVAEVVGGWLAWDWTAAERVLERWAEWAVDAPEEITTSARILQLPPLPEIPEPVRGRQLVVIDGAWCGDPAEADAALAPLRALEPEIDTWAPMPAAGLVRVHGDPEEPMPGLSDAAMLGACPAEAVRAFVAAAGPDSGSALLMAELRQLGGALGRTPERHGALPTLDAPFALFALGLPLDEETAAAVAASCARLLDAMAPWVSGRKYLNFVEHATDTAGAYRADAHRRLQEIRRDVDPDGLLQANHEIDA